MILGKKIEIHLVEQLAPLTYNPRRFDTGQGTYNVVNKKRGLSDETKNCGPLSTLLSMPGQANNPTHSEWLGEQ
jgi:hypothetical protein